MDLFTQRMNNLRRRWRRTVGLIKNEMKKYNIDIPEKYFYSVEELIQIMVTYNIQSFSDQAYFEEWLISEIIIPINSLIQNIRNSVADPTKEIEVYEKLTEYFLLDTKDEQIIKDFKYFCQQFAPFWKNIE